MGSSDDGPRFEDVDWDDIDGSTSPPSEHLVLLGGAALLVALYLYDTFVAHVYLVGEWNVAPIDWALLLAVVVLVSYGLVPIARRRRNASRVLSRLRSHPRAMYASVYVLAVLIAGAVGPLLYPAPGMQFQYGLHPPVGFSTQAAVLDCQGAVTGGAFDRSCHGTMAFPLGTNHRGHPMSYLLLTGARVALYVIAITAAFVVPLAAVVGLLAGLRGGLLDDALMGYVDLQLCLPAILVYVVANAYWHTSLFVLLATFGLLSWGGVARNIRSEVLKRREAGHVRVARGFGASWRYLARRHILPNVTNTLVPATFHLLALLVFVEAGVAFLDFHDVELYSWGSTIDESFSAGEPEHVVWWIWAFPGITLVLTVFALKLVGDGLRDALDPRDGV